MVVQGDRSYSSILHGMDHNIYANPIYIADHGGIFYSPDLQGKCYDIGLFAATIEYYHISIYVVCYT